MGDVRVNVLGLAGLLCELDVMATTTGKDLKMAITEQISERVFQVIYAGEIELLDHETILKILESDSVAFVDESVDVIVSLGSAFDGQYQACISLPRNTINQKLTIAGSVAMIGSDQMCIDWKDDDRCASFRHHFFKYCISFRGKDGNAGFTGQVTKLRDTYPVSGTWIE